MYESFICMYVFMHNTSAVPEEARRGTGSHRTGVTESPCGCWDPDVGSPLYAVISLVNKGTALGL